MPAASPANPDPTMTTSYSANWCAVTAIPSTWLCAVYPHRPLDGKVSQWQ